MPGVNAERIEVVGEPGAIVVRGTRPVPLVPGLSVRRLEIPYGIFERRIRLPLQIEKKPAVSRRPFCLGSLDQCVESVPLPDRLPELLPEMPVPPTPSEPEPEPLPEPLPEMPDGPTPSVPVPEPLPVPLALTPAALSDPEPEPLPEPLPVIPEGPMPSAPEPVPVPEPLAEVPRGAVMVPLLLPVPLPEMPSPPAPCAIAAPPNASPAAAATLERMWVTFI
jgi:hypothetical protein